MKKSLIALALAAAAASGWAHETTYSIVTTWFEPQTQPRDTIFTGTFDYDEHTHTVSNLQGMLSESMTDTNGMPKDADHMVWLPLMYQLDSWYDAALGGTFAAVFKNNSTDTFWKGAGGDGWSPAAGIANGGIYAGFPASYATSTQNSYILIFVRILYSPIRPSI